MRKDTKLKLLFLFLLLFWGGTSFVYALEINYPRFPGAIPPQDFLTSAAPEDILSLCVKYFVNFFIWVGGILALAGLIYGGIKYLLSAGKIEATVSARNQIASAFFGLLILLSSYLILNILSPEFTILKISPLEKIEPIEKRYVVPPSTSSVYSSIDVELPFGRIIERIFETYISDLPDSIVKTPRIERIKENISETSEIANKLKKQSEDLKGLADKCQCKQADPVCSGCQALGAPVLGDILGVDGLLQYNNITGNISNIVGAGNLGQALDFSTNLASSIGNISDFSNVLNSFTNISGIIPLPDSLTQVFGAAGDLAIISENPKQLFGSIGELSSLITVPANLTQVFEFAKTGLNIIENPNNLGNLLGSVKEMSNIAGLNLIEVFQAVGPIGNIVKDPKDLNTIFGAVQDTSNKVGVNLDEVFKATGSLGTITINAQDLKGVFGGIEGISNKVGGNLNDVFQIALSLKDVAENPKDLKTIFGTMEIISSKVGLKLPEVFKAVEPIKDVAKNPQDLASIFGEVKDISDKTGVNLNEVFLAAWPVGKVVKTPQDLNVVFGAIEEISNRVDTPVLNKVFEIAGEASKTAQNPQELVDIVTPQITKIIPPVHLNIVLENIGNIANAAKGMPGLINIQAAVQDLSKIGLTPQQLTSVFGNFQDISGLVNLPTDLGSIQVMVSEISRTVPIHQERTMILGNLGDISGLIKNPADLGNIQTAVSQLSKTIPILQQLTGVLGDLGNISGLIKAPTDFGNIQTAVQGLSKIGLAPKQLTDVLGNLGDISGVVKVPADLGSIQTAVQGLSNIIPIPQNLTNLLGDLQGISGLIKDPANLGGIQSAVQELSNIIPLPQNLTNILGNLQGISGIIQDPTNLGNIQTAVGQLSGLIPNFGNFTGILGNFGDISGIIQDPTNLSNVMGSLGGLPQITPLGQLPNVLGQINVLGALFQGPQNMVSAFIGVGGSCTCDPCRKVRGDIEKIEKDNLTQIHSLKTEQEKTINEIKDLKSELGKLERLESFINYCPATFKNSYAEFLALKKSYESGGGIVREISFWDDIIIPYVNKKGKMVPDWATILCTIGGNILPTTRSLFEEEQKMEEVVVKEKPKACSNEIPVGEIIDRTKRTTSLLITKLEKLVGLDKEIIDAIDDLQVLVSQCTSQAPNCRSICIPLPHGGCYKKCVGSPCPTSKIKKQVQKIQEIEKKIEKVINDPLDKIEKEKSGILSLINPNNPDSVVSRILEELDKIQILTAGTRGIRYPLQVCGVAQSEEILLACQQARGDIDPEGRIVRQCCLEELVFQECLEKCYLEEGVAEYKICLQGCLDEQAEKAKKAGVPRPEEISQCRHSLNFFCCLR